jgi:serine/threonine protein phosphatase 1
VGNVKRTIIIGDLHGCYEEALDLLDAASVSESDRVVFVGDLVDRGPKPRECVELAMRHECVRGNHEDKHLAMRRRPDDSLLPDHLRTRRALDAAHYDYFARLPTFLLLPEYDAAVIHAGALPGKPIASQDPYHLMHAQCVAPPDRKSFWPSKAPASHTFWTRHWKGPERAIFGHTVLDRPLVTEHAVGIDTGCVYGHSLTAVILPEWRIVSVPSRQAKRAEKRIATYELDGGARGFS